MSGTASLFEAEYVPIGNLNLPHPYPRYGIAVALLKKREVTEEELREALIEAIEDGLGEFRMKAIDDPQVTRLLHFTPITLETLKSDPSLIQSSGLAARGIYIYPSVVTTDGNAKDTFQNAIAIIKALREGEALDSTLNLSRSFAPTTSKINNGTASQTPPKGTLLEAAGALITTLTPLKPAAWPGQNTVIIPDLQLPELYDFIELFNQMWIQGARGNIMDWQLPDKPPSIEATLRKGTKKAATPKSEYHRPRLHGGNYLFAPRDAGIFGAAGLLGAIGRMAHEAVPITWAERVLKSIAGDAERGTPSAPLYIISYDKISQVRFSHHIVRLALEGKLSEMIDRLWIETRLYADLDSPRPRHDAPAYKLFYMMTSRFLQHFTAPAFQDFLATRAEYPSQLRPLFEEYFMNTQGIAPNIVHSARALGQHLNLVAYIVADNETEPTTAQRSEKVSKAKAKILVEFESAVMSAKSPVDMLHRISTRAGRLLQNDLPAEATAYMDATAISDELTFLNAQHLIIAYLRLRPPGKNTGVVPIAKDATVGTEVIEPELEIEKDPMGTE